MREWQLLGQDDWVFGVKVRGIVRDYEAQIYFDEDDDSREGGWKWLVFGSPTREGASGRAMNLTYALQLCEERLGVA